jgi:2OG-Fe(II) oxygenase superfamily
MVTEAVIGALIVTAGAIALLKWQRGRLYARLGDRLERIVNSGGFDVGAATERAIPSFNERLVVLPEFLPARIFTALREEAERLVAADDLAAHSMNGASPNPAGGRPKKMQGAPERSYVPAHKKGGTIAYETLIALAPGIVAFYHSPQIMKFVSRIAGVKLVPTPLYDQSSLSVLVYERPGDHIGWHYDLNFYRGRHFTVLLALDNRGTAEGGLSHAALKARIASGEVSVSSAPNTTIVFEGAAVRHKVTPILEGERRLILSMTYCTDPGATLWQGVSRRLKDVAFFGPRALWT